MIVSYAVASDVAVALHERGAHEAEIGYPDDADRYAAAADALASELVAVAACHAGPVSALPSVVLTEEVVALAANLGLI
jgi:hypothetical protein